MRRRATRRNATTRRRARPPAAVAARLAHLFHRNGYFRWQNEQRLTAAGSDAYKKGYEVRLAADSAKELAEIRRLLRAAGFKSGRPFVKGRQYRHPVYGKEAVARFLELVGEAPA